MFTMRLGGKVILIPNPRDLVATMAELAKHNEVPIGQPGEIAIKGPQVIAGYWQRPAETGLQATQGGGVPRRVAQNAGWKVMRRELRDKS